MTAWIIDRVTSWIQDVLPGPIRRALGISSPSEVMADIGRNSGEGLAQGLESKTSRVEGAGADFVAKLTNRLKQGTATVATAGKSLADALADTVRAAMDRLSLSTQVLQAQWELQQKEMAATAAEADKLSAQLSFEQRQLAMVNDRISVLTGAYEQMKQLKGDNAEETKRFLLELLKEKAAYIDISNAMEDLKKKQQELAGLTGEMSRLGFTDVGDYARYKLVETQVNAGLPVVGDVDELKKGLVNAMGKGQYDEAVRAMAKLQNVDLGVAESMVWSKMFDQYKAGQLIPKFHQGGVFRAPTPGGEGLALLRDRERVIPGGRDGAIIDYDRLGEAIARALTGLKVQGDVTVRVDGTGKMREFRLAY